MPLKTHLDEQPTLNLTPMIDIVFLLIIFFMVGTTFTQAERDLDLQVPEVRNAGALTDAPAKRVVNVYRDGRVTLDRQSVTLSQLTSQLHAARRQYPQLGVHVRGDAMALHQRITEVLCACKQAGIKELGISVKYK